MFGKMTKPAARPFDLSALPGGEQLLRGIHPMAKPIIARGGIEILRANPGARRGDVARLAHPFWADIRGQLYDGQHTVEYAIVQSGNPPLYLLENVLGLFVQVADLEQTLERQIAELSALLADIRTVRGEVAAPPKDAA